MTRAELVSWFHEHRGQNSRKLSVHLRCQVPLLSWTFLPSLKACPSFLTTRYSNELVLRLLNISTMDSSSQSPLRLPCVCPDRLEVLHLSVSMVTTPCPPPPPPPPHPPGEVISHGAQLTLPLHPAALPTPPTGTGALHAGGRCLKDFPQALNGTWLRLCSAVEDALLQMVTCAGKYYCCKKNDSEVDMGSVVGADPLSHFPCNACNALAMDGAPITPVSLDQLDTGSHLNHCPSCSPYPLRSGLTDDMRNGGERLGFHTYYENPSVSLPLSANPQASTPLSFYGPSDLFPPPPRPYSTQV
ncbi:hypothetical protein INR49_014324 [Caranx melampygus]|nr:hypothetical protein INR49_014324 [Caranx melampygus]